ncbi:MAG: metallophosphoesterase, partial [Propionibacteriaceae bacterium]|nr:metallophosphoesterase [Propionibacteriaceae bacterium]
FGVILVGGFLTLSLARRLEHPADWRWLTAPLLVGLAFVFYLALGLAVLGVVNLVWHPVEWLVRRRSDRSDRADRAGRAGHVGPDGSEGGPGQSGLADGPWAVERPWAADPDPPAAGGAGPRRADPAFDQPRHRRRGPQPVTARTRTLRWAVPIIVTLAVATTVYGTVQARTVEVTDVTVTSADLPAAFAGFRVALISDIHVGPGVSGDFVDALVDQVNALEPDLVAIAGDLVDGTVAQLGPELAGLGRLQAPYGTVVVTGNHEFHTGDVDHWLAYLEGLGLTVLDNSGIELTRQGATIDVLGINDVRGTGAHTDDLLAAVTTLERAFGTPADGAGRFRLLVAHQPVQATTGGDAPARFGVDVQLSGHTHGGQLWPFHYAVLTQQPVLDGVHDIDGVTVVTSHGVGEWGPPVRVLADPEIVLVTLARPCQWGRFLLSHFTRPCHPERSEGSLPTKVRSFAALRMTEQV